MTAPAIRKWCFAGINLAFLLPLLGWNLPTVIAALVLLQLALHRLSEAAVKAYIVALLGFGAIALFLLHKNIPSSAHLYLPGTFAVLSAIGYSFFVLRVAEVVRAVAEEQSSPPDFPSLVNYLLPFHMLAAGPIQAYHEFAEGNDRALMPAQAREVLAGAERIARGLFKKFVLAVLIQKSLLTDFQTPGIYFYLELHIFIIWLYLDFSAYSDIAVGIGKIIGVPTPENFNNPLVARNLIDFWERWHISLSLFIRRNIFTPLQIFLIRRAFGPPLVCAAVALLISFVFCGMWHGISMGWLMWGLLHAAGIVIVRCFDNVLHRAVGPEGVKRYRASSFIRCVSTALTFEYVTLSFLPVALLSSNFSIVW